MIIPKQSFLRRKDSTVILLSSLSQFKITLSIISEIIRFSLEVVSIVVYIVVHRSGSGAAAVVGEAEVK